MVLLNLHRLKATASLFPLRNILIGETCNICDSQFLDFASVRNSSNKAEIV